MKCTPSKQIRYSLRLVLIMTTACQAAATAYGEHDSTEELTFAETQSQAVIGLVQAQCKLELWNLERLKSLRERGFASWLELARQQLVVDLLTEQRRGHEKFAKTLQHFHQRALVASKAAHNDKHTRRNGLMSPVIVSIPGSVRMIGWLEPDHVPSTLVSQYHTARSRLQPESSEVDEQLKQAEENLICAEKRFSDYTKAGSTLDTGDRARRAELKLAVARAELNALKARRDLHRSSDTKLSNYQTSLVGLQTAKENTDTDGVNIADILHCINFDSNDNLRVSTLRVAAAEANATGELRAAEAILRKEALRHEAYQKLHDDGHANQEELDDARNRVAQAKKLVQQELNRRNNLKRSYERLLATADSLNLNEAKNNAGSLSDAESGKSAEPSLPLSLLADCSAVRHLFDLRRHYYETLAERNSFRLMLGLSEAHLAKLKAIASLKVANGNDPADPTDEDSFRTILAAGKRREVKLFELEVGYQRARLQAAEENLDISALEERRFVLQYLEQRGVDAELARHDGAQHYRGTDRLDVRPVAYQRSRPKAGFPVCSYLDPSVA